MSLLKLHFPDWCLSSEVDLLTTDCSLSHYRISDEMDLYLFFPPGFSSFRMFLNIKRNLLILLTLLLFSDLSPCLVLFLAEVGEGPNVVTQNEACFLFFV